MENDVDAMGRIVLKDLAALVSELNVLDEQHQARRAAATKLEQREMCMFLPGLRDHVGDIEGSKRCVQRVLKARREQQAAASGIGVTIETSSLSDRQEEDLQDKRDRETIKHIAAHPYAEKWTAVKKSRGLLSLHRRVSGKDLKLGPVVDAVVENGMEWLKLLGVNERRLIQQMAQDGWHADDDSDDDDSDVLDDSDSAIELVKIATQLVKAARQNRCNGRRPRLHFLLPKINQGQVAVIDKLLDKIRHMGISKQNEGHVEIIVDCANSAFAEAIVPPLDKAIANLFRNTHIDRLTSTLNLDLTVLLSLVSDITHSNPDIKYWWSDQTQAYIRDEEHAPGMRLRGLYVALRKRHLVCTEDVVLEFRRIVQELGTPSTQARAAILFGIGTDEPEALGGHDLAAQFQQLSIHPVPDDLKLPIEVIRKEEFRGDRDDILEAIEARTLPQVAIHVFTKLDRVYHQTCHLYGWKQNITTVSANILNVRQIEAVFDQCNTNGDDVGPDIFLTPLAISINTASPCPSDVWDKIKDVKNERRNARETEARKMKNTGVWGPTVGQALHSEQRRGRKTSESQTTFFAETCE